MTELFNIIMQCFLMKQMISIQTPKYLSFFYNLINTMNESEEQQQMLKQ